MGKCYSKCDRGQRNKSDFYQTPYSITKALLKKEFFSKKRIILEPACGRSAITYVLIENEYSVEQYDKFHRLIHIKKDFLKEDRLYKYIITNPPYSLANEFIKKAMEICTNKFAFLLPLNYLQGQKRYDNNIWCNQEEEFELVRVHVFTRMPTLKNTIRSDGKFETGMQAYAWFVWERKIYCRLTPIISWIDCKDMVVRKNEI